MLTREQYFPGQAQEEQVALFIRRHFMAFVPWIVVFLLCFLLLNLGLIGLWNFAPDLAAQPTDWKILVVFLAAMSYLALIFFFLRAWMSYYLDVTIVTERRLIDIEQEGIFRRQIAEQSLVRVQDVSSRQVGFFQHLLNYGTLFIETAGEQPNFELHNIPRPNDVAKTIINLHDRLLERTPRTGQIIDVDMAEGMYGAHPQVEVLGLDAPHPRHPLEELRPYFPEPGRAHHHPPPKSYKHTSKPHALPEGELHDGEIIHVGDRD